MLSILVLAASLVAPAPLPAPTTAAELSAMVSLLGAPASPALVDPCVTQLNAELAAAEAWVQMCISADPNGPLPCIDWPECCSEEGERRRAWAWWNYWTCKGVYPGPMPPGSPPNVN